jgi:hypothetical protein
MSIANIKAVLRQADQIDVREGLSAYENYNAICSRLAEYYGYRLPVVVGVFVALSPNNDYIGNLRSAVTLLKGYRQGAPCEALTVTTYNKCKLRAWRVLTGEDFLNVSQGLKTRNFYLNILDPNDPHPITIDGHMVCIWKGERRALTKVGGWRYSTLAHDYKAVAFSEFILPAQLQAILWFTWKRINRILYKEQLNLFSDAWRMRLDVADIKPYGCIR